MSLRERLLIRRLRERDESAFREMVDEYSNRVFSLTLRMLGDREEAEDLAQEVFLRTFKALPSFDPEGPAKLSTWIYRVATRLCIDELRRRRPSSVREELELLAHARSDSMPAARPTPPIDRTRGGETPGPRGPRGRGPTTSGSWGLLRSEADAGSGIHQ